MNLKERNRVRLKSFASLKFARRLATHEAAHAVVAHVLDAWVEMVTIAYNSPRVRTESVHLKAWQVTAQSPSTPATTVCGSQSRGMT